MENEYCLVWKQALKSWFVRVSSVVQSVPFWEPWSIQSRGSRPAASLAEVSAYSTTLTGSIELELDPGRTGEYEPLGLVGAVDEVLLDLATLLVLAAGADRDDAVGDVAGEALVRRPGDARGLLGGVRPRGLRIVGLER